MVRVNPGQAAAENAYAAGSDGSWPCNARTCKPATLAKVASKRVRVARWLPRKGVPNPPTDVAARFQQCDTPTGAPTLNSTAVRANSEGMPEQSNRRQPRTVRAREQTKQ
jgi:hypothetical protein